jgi:hypothetical protein
MRKKQIFSIGQLQLFFRLLILTVIGADWGCSTVNVAEQRLVSKSNMVFSDSPVFSDTSNYHPLLEPGTAGSGGGQASECTSCK